MAGSFIDLDCERLLHNIRLFRGCLGRDRLLMAVLKANAYGHGVGILAPLVAEHVDWIGVDSLEEALELQRVGVGCPILILGHSPTAAAPTIVRKGFRQVLFRRDLGEALVKAGERLGKEAIVHLKIETGLHRLGVSADELPEWAAWLSEQTVLRLEGLYTHFADVEEVGSTFYQTQLERLRGAETLLARAGITPEILHATPTAGALLRETTRLQLARIGIGLFGVWPSPEVGKAFAGDELKPVLSWRTRLVQVRSVPPGETVGYDRSYRATDERRIGIIPVGYADGLDRRLSNRGVALVVGSRVPIVGRVAMNMTMLDVTETDAEMDAEVVLIGEQDGSAITAEEQATTIDTIAYEVLARLSRRLPRRLRTSES